MKKLLVSFGEAGVEALVIGGDVMGRDPFCEMYKMLYGHIEDRLRLELSRAEPAT